MEFVIQFANNQHGCQAMKALYVMSKIPWGIIFAFSWEIYIMEDPEK